MFTGVLVPGDKFIARTNHGVNDTDDKFFAGVVDTGLKHTFTNISINFKKKFKTAPMEYLGAWGDTYS